MHSLERFEERRKHPRFAIVLPLDLEETHGAVVYNLSEGGLLIHSVQNMPVGRELKVRVLFAEEYQLDQFEGTARVAWKDYHSESDWEGYKYALEFVEISPEDRRKLVNLLEENP
jgi:c-di-GMP-binding flagellar brake protein YcgR